MRCGRLRFGGHRWWRTVVFWLGFWFLREDPGATLGRFFASLAVVGTWGEHQPPSGVVGRGPRATRRCHRRCRAGLCLPLPLAGPRGPFYSFRGVPSEISGWLDRTGGPPAGLGPAKIKKGAPLHLKIQASHICPLEGVGGVFFPARAQLCCGTPDIRAMTGDLCGVCLLRSALRRPFLGGFSPRRGYEVPSSRHAAQRNRSFANHRVQGEKHAKNGAIRVPLFALFLLRFCMFALLCMLSR
jgi:hypothetical protein